MNFFFIPLVSFPKKVEGEYFFSRIRILFQRNNRCWLIFRCGYSTTNNATCYPFVPIIIILKITFLNSSIIKILLTVVLYRKMWLIIHGILLFTILPITIWFFSLKNCIWNYHILTNGWYMTTGWQPVTNNFNDIFF